MTADAKPSHQEVRIEERVVSEGQRPLKRSMLGRPLENVRPELAGTDPGQQPMFKAGPEPAQKTPITDFNNDRSTGAAPRATSQERSKQPAADVDASPGKRAPEKVEAGMPGLHGAQSSSRSGHIPGAAGSPAPRASRLGLGIPDVQPLVPRHPQPKEPDHGPHLEAAGFYEVEGI